MPWALNTPIAVWNAGSESACVSRATNNGPAIPSAFRCRAIASLMARTWASVNVPLSEVPRWPEVPNETGPWGSRRYAAYSSSRSTSIAAFGRVPAEGLTRRTIGTS